jgi:hypothetical protein
MLVSPLFRAKLLERWRRVHRDRHHDHVQQEYFVRDLTQLDDRPAAQQARIPAAVAERQRRHHERGDGCIEDGLAQQARPLTGVDAAEGEQASPLSWPG